YLGFENGKLICKGIPEYFGDRRGISLTEFDITLGHFVFGLTPNETFCPELSAIFTRRGKVRVLSL
ncbi:unnamed protein product, partial [Rotaria magnacalcarata]